jgi:LuxR family transcriptional regulator, maltose regulon positive regulatory protein
VALAGVVDPSYPTFLTLVVVDQQIHRFVTVEMICFRYIRAHGLTPCRRPGPQTGGTMNHIVVDGRLTIPPLPSRHIRRPRLLVALDSALARPLTLVAAGPGSGKSVLLSDWAASRPTPPAWISLERSDDDPVRFWPAVAAALSVARGHSAGAATDGIADVLVPVLLRADGEPTVLILDDAHVLTNRSILAALDDAIREWRDQLRLVIAARSDPLLALHRHRRSGDVTELRASALAMTADESSAILAAHGVRLSQHDFDVVTARTEGWAAGIRLSAMSMEGAARPSKFVAELALDQGSVGEYLMDEVLDHQPGEVRRLLIETSFLEQVSGPLAAAVTGLDDAGGLLAELARTNSFVLPVDRSSERFRYHHLLLEILRYLLRREPAAHRRQLHLRAAHWYAAAGDISQALQYAADAKDWAFAAQLLARGGLAQALVDRLALDSITGEQFVGAIADNREYRAELLVAAAALFAYDGRFELAREQLDRLESRFVDTALATSIALVELLLACARADAAAATRWFAAVAARADRPGLLGAARLEHAMSLFYAGSHGDVESTLLAAADDARCAGADALELACVAQLAHVSAIWGRYTAARAYEGQAARLLHRCPLLAVPATMLFSAAARAYAKADFASALPALRRAHAAQLDRRDHALRKELTLLETQLMTVVGQVAQAQQTSIEEQLGDGLIADFQAFVCANIEIALGRPNVAVRLLTSDRDPSEPSIANVALCRALLARGDLDEASEALRPILTAGGGELRTVLVEALVADAQIAHARKGGDAHAVTSLLRAIELAGNDFVMPFVCVNEELAELRRRHPMLERSWPIPPDTSPHVSDDGDAEVFDLAVREELTDRERAVLRWLTTTMSTGEIADELCLSVNTVKTHIAAIYRKLSASRRREAVVRARKFELL